MNRNRYGPQRLRRIVCDAFGAALLVLLFHPSPDKADVVILETGRVINGTILQQDDEGVLIQMDYGTYRYPKSWVKDVRKETIDSPGQTNGTQRIPSWAKIVSTLATNGWAHELKQIPAPVIDRGFLKNVPYVSFSCNSGGYEVNIYGDLDKPAAVQVGAIKYLVNNDDARTNCVNFLSSLLAEDDQTAVRALSMSRKDMENKNGMTFENMLPFEPDAYGGWWMSVYDENALTHARASGSELLSITQPGVITNSQPVWGTAQPAATTPVSNDSWTPDEMTNAPPAAASHAAHGHRVYVRAYTRKNGTYAAHTNKAATPAPPVSKKVVVNGVP